MFLLSEGLMFDYGLIIHRKMFLSRVLNKKKYLYILKSMLYFWHGYKEIFHARRITKHKNNL